jgi:4-hydroxy-tetrahydrodipicolinate reductase
MGRVLATAAAKELDIEILCGIDQNKEQSNAKAGFPIYQSFGCHELKTDVIIDFSHPNALKALLGFGILHQTPIVVATTGLGPEEHRILQEAAELIPIFQSANMSLGINMLCKVLETLTPALEPEFDIEIIEKHHKHKKDAPSGTTFLLIDAIGHSCPTHSIRSGTIPGEHTVIYSGPDEVLEFTHTAYSPEIFARGALSAARFLLKQKPGLYNMKNLL